MHELNNILTISEHHIVGVTLVAIMYITVVCLYKYAYKVPINIQSPLCSK